MFWTVLSALLSCKQPGFAPSSVFADTSSTENALAHQEIQNADRFKYPSAPSGRSPVVNDRFGFKGPPFSSLLQNDWQ